MTRTCIALGGNLGPVQDHFSEALALLAHAGCRIAAVSSLYRSAPVGSRAAGDFLNAGALVDSDLSAEKLLELLLSIETRCGRTRESRWGARTLDLDLIFFGDAVYESERLVVPHPAGWFRRFVLDPTAELLPAFVHPVKRVTVEALKQRLLVRPMTLALAGSEDKQSLLAAARSTESSDCNVVLWADWPAHCESSQEPTFIVWTMRASSVATAAGDDPRFLALPLVPRIDATRSQLPLPAFLSYLIDASQGRVERVESPGGWFRGEVFPSSADRAN